MTADEPDLIRHVQRDYSKERGRLGELPPRKRIEQGVKSVLTLILTLMPTTRYNTRQNRVE